MKTLFTMIVGVGCVMVLAIPGLANGSSRLKQIARPTGAKVGAKRVTYTDQEIRIQGSQEAERAKLLKWMDKIGATKKAADAGDPAARLEYARIIKGQYYYTTYRGYTDEQVAAELFPGK